MRQARLPMLVALLAAVAVVPAAAEVYTVTLTNGSLFESRYLPRQAAWDAGMIELATETGAWIALPKSLVQSVTALSETKGFGRVINTTTVDLGFAPNDLPEVPTVDNSAMALEDAMNRSYDIEQFAEPNQAGRGSSSGGGLPIWGVAGGGGGGGFTPPLPAPAPVPVPAPPPAAPAPPGGTGSSPQ